MKTFETQRNEFLQTIRTKDNRIEELLELKTELVLSLQNKILENIELKKQLEIYINNTQK